MLCNAYRANKKLFRSTRLDVALVLILRDYGLWLPLCPRSTQRKIVNLTLGLYNKQAVCSLKKFRYVVIQLPLA